MFSNIEISLSNTISLHSFTLFSEYFIGTSIFYILIVCIFVTYNVYGLMIQKAISECIALILLLACYLIFNDDLIVFGYAICNNTIINDYLSFITKIIICLVSIFYFLIIANSLKNQRLTSFEYLLIALFSILGLLLLCSSNDLLTAYLSIELISLSCYLLAAFKKTSNYSVESGIKYFIIGSVSSAFFLLGSSFIYGVIGSICLFDFSILFPNKFLINFLFLEDGLVATEMNLFDFDQQRVDKYDELCDINLRHSTKSYLIEKIDFNFLEIGLSLLLFSIFIKLALAPFHLWSLDVYEGSPTSATFFFAVVAKLSFFVFLVRLCCSLSYFRECWDFYSLWIGLFSIFVGAFGGLKQRRLKTLMAYSSTTHMGYMLLFFDLTSPIATLLLFYYLIVYMIAGLTVWSIILCVQLQKKELKNKSSKELGDFVLLKKSNPALAFAFALTVFSIAGIPPLLGFLAKMSIFFSLIMFPSGYYIALISILFSVVSTFYYIRIVKILYFENILIGKLYYPIKNNQTLIISFLTFLLIYLFINPTILYLLIYKLVFTFKESSDLNLLY